MKTPINQPRLLFFAVFACLAIAGEPTSARQPENVHSTTNIANPAGSMAATNEATPAPIVPAQQTPETPDTQPRRSQEHPVFFSDFVLEPGTTNFGDAVTLKGSSIINGVLTGSSVTFFGDASVNGAVSRDVIVIMGSARLGPETRIGGGVVVFGGKLQREKGAVIQGESVEIDPEKVPGLRGALDWIMNGLLLGRPLPFSVGWAWMVAGCLLLINLLVLLIFPRSIQTSLETMVGRPASSFFSGMLALLLSGLLGVLLIISVVGTIVLPFLVAGMFAAFMFGKIAVYRYVGQQLGRQAHLAFLSAPAVALLFGTGIFYLLYTVPVLGFMAWGFTSIFGVGAVFLASIQKFRSERGKAPTAPTPALAAPTLSSENPAPPTPLETSLLPRAGFWIRMCALMLDFLLFLIMAAAIECLRRPDSFLIVWWVYHVVLWTWRSSTIGGIIMGIKLVRVDGRPVDFMAALIRSLAAVFSAVVLGTGFLWVVFDRNKQSWHDKIAGTVMVKVPKEI